MHADEIAAAGIVIDADGRRFADEGFGGIYLSNAVARLPDPLGATIRPGDLGPDRPAAAMRSRPIRCRWRRAARYIAPARLRSWPD